MLQAARPRSSSTTTASIAEHQLFLDLCQQHGVRLDPSICLSSTAWGLGLAVACQTQQPHQQPCDDDAVVQVPLDLVLSCSIQGCSPGPQQVTPALQQVLHASEVSQSWEMQVAVLLLWALRQPPQSRIGGFWQQYRPLLPGSVQDCASLLVWSDSELAQLQVSAREQPRADCITPVELRQFLAWVSDSTDAVRCSSKTTSPSRLHMHRLTCEVLHILCATPLQSHSVDNIRWTPAGASHTATGVV